MPDVFGVNSTCWVRVYAVGKIEISPAPCVYVLHHKLRRTRTVDKKKDWQTLMRPIESRDKWTWLK